MRGAEHSQPSISIVTPSLNQGRYLADALESVIAQEHPSVEHIVVEGGSDDDSRAILDRYAAAWPHVRVIEDVPPRGQSAALNVGFRAARGDIVGWLNADDRYCRGAFEAVADAFAEGDASVVYGDWEVIDANGDVVFRHVAGAFDRRRLLDGINETIAQPTVFFRRELFDRVGYLDESLHYVMDFDLWLRASAVTEFAYVRRTLAQFRRHAESKTQSRPGSFYEEARPMCRAHGGPFFSAAFRRRSLERLLGTRLATHVLWHWSRGADAALGRSVVAAAAERPACPLCRYGLLGGRAS